MTAKHPGLVVYHSPQHGPVLTHPRWWWSVRDILRHAGQPTHRIREADRLAHNRTMRARRKQEVVA